jgi:hypothetical protein
MTVTELISMLQQMPPEALVGLGEHNRDTVVSVRKFDIALVALRDMKFQHRKAYETVAHADEHDAQGVLLR